MGHGRTSDGARRAVGEYEGSGPRYFLWVKPLRQSSPTSQRLALLLGHPPRSGPGAEVLDLAWMLTADTEDARGVAHHER